MKEIFRMIRSKGKDICSLKMGLYFKEGLLMICLMGRDALGVPICQLFGECGRMEY